MRTKKNKKYYILEVRYKPNHFLLDEMEYYSSQKKAQRVCDRLNNELETAEEIIMINKPFVGKGEVSFDPKEIYYTVSGLRERMLPEGK